VAFWCWSIDRIATYWYLLSAMTTSKPLPFAVGGKRRELIVTWAFFLLVALVIMGPALVSGRIPGYGLDNIMHAWFWGWFAVAIAHHWNPFFSNYGTTPITTNLLWNNANLVFGLVTWPLMASIGPITTIGVVYVALITAGGGFMAMQIRPHVKHLSSALVGGLFFCFAPWMQSELAAGHLSEFSVATIPLGWWVGKHLLRAARESRRLPVWSAMAGAWIVLQYWVNKEILATSLVVGLGFLLVYLTRGKKINLRLERRWLVGAVIGCGVVITLLAFPLMVQFASRGTPHGFTNTSPNSYVIDLLAYIVPGYGQMVAFGFTHAIAGKFTGNALEVDGYLGLPLIAVLVWIGVKRHADNLVRFGIVCAAVAAVVAAGPWVHIGGVRLDIPLPGLILEHLPIFDLMVPARAMMFVLIGVACMIAGGWDAMMEPRNRRTLILAAAIVAMTLLPSVGEMTGVWGFSLPPPPRVLSSSTLRSLPLGATVVLVPSATRGNHGVSMYWQVLDDFRFKDPFGYMLRPEPGLGYQEAPPPSPLSNVVTSLSSGQKPSGVPLSKLNAQMQSWHIAAIVVAPGPEYGISLRWFTKYLGEPILVDGAAVWLHPSVRDR
jgi:hypothetical protein